MVKHKPDNLGGSPPAYEPGSPDPDTKGKGGLVMERILANAQARLLVEKCLWRSTNHTHPVDLLNRSTPIEHRGPDYPLAYLSILTVRPEPYRFRSLR